jgi:HEAT repeat protein
MSAYSSALRDQLMAQAIAATEDLARPSWGTPVLTYKDGIRDAIKAIEMLDEFYTHDEQVTVREVLTALRGLVDNE